MKNAKKICKKLVKNAQAVSPIIATLMLVLVAVGSAGAFYVWQSGWQGDIEGKVSGSGELQASLTIGGSSTVYEFSAIAAEYYSAANPNYKVSYQKGGSGAGVASVGTGAVDIGSASRFVKTGEKDDYPDLNKDNVKDFGRELVEHVVAWDAVAVVVPEANSHGLVSINETVLRDIYYFNGDAASYTLQVLVDSNNNSKIEWNEVYTTAGSTAVNCTGTEAVTIYDRDDKSGTEEVFSQQILETGEDTLEEAGITNVNHEASNQNLLQAIADDANALSFMSYGMAKVSGSGLEMISFQGGSDTSPVMPSKTTIMQKEPGQYDGARPLVYITVGDPTGDIKVYIDFCLQPENNKNICAASDYISLY